MSKPQSLKPLLRAAWKHFYFPMLATSTLTYHLSNRFLAIIVTIAAMTVLVAGIVRFVVTVSNYVVSRRGDGDPRILVSKDEFIAAVIGFSFAALLGTIAIVRDDYFFP